MSGIILILVLSSAALHPLREFFIKGDATPEGVTLAVNIWFFILAGAQVFATGQDPWVDRKSTRLNSSHPSRARMPSSA